MREFSSPHMGNAGMKGSYSGLSGNKHSVPSLPLMPYPSPLDLAWLFRHFVARPEAKCAQCGAHIIAPQWSEHLSETRVRNVWSCEACGYQFEDTVYVKAADDRRRPAWW
jgi:DNA-directed RNA polymerase subunit RPC12/RpoP